MLWFVIAFRQHAFKWGILTGISLTGMVFRLAMAADNLDFAVVFMIAAHALSFAFPFTVVATTLCVSAYALFNIRDAKE